jgi:hypothetical protein
MTHTRKLSLLLAPVLLASVVFAQTRDNAEANASRDDAVSAARSRYVQTSEISPETDHKTLAQLHRGGPARPFPPHRGYPRGTYQTPWMDHGSAGHVLIGAAVGFGVGAALGAQNSARNGTPVAGGILIGGGLLGFLGGCAGKAVGDLQGIHFAPTHRRRTYWPSGPEDDEESNLRRPAKEDHPESSASPAAPSREPPEEPAAP